MAGGYTTVGQGPSGVPRQAGAGPSTLSTPRPATARPAAAPGAAPAPGGYGIPGYQSIAQRPAPNGDPAYLAYLRNLGLQESHAFSGFGQNVNDINNRYNLSLSDANRINPIAQENLHGSFETRGIYSSGQHATAFSRLLAQQASERSNLALAHAQALGQARSGFQGQLDQLAQQRADQEMALQVRLAGGGLANFGSGLPSAP